MLLQIPLRNLSRNLRRTLLGIGIIAMGTMMSYAVIGYVDFSLLQIRETVVQQYGNIQVGSPLLWEEDFEEYNFLLSPEEVSIIYSALDEDPRVIAKTQQLNLSGLAYIGNRTAVLRITALEPENLALDYNNLVIEGAGLSTDDRARILVGRSFARQYGLGVGDGFTIRVYTTSGQLNISDVRIAGIYQLTDGEIEGQVAFMPLSFGKLLMNTDKVAKVIAKTADIDMTDSVALATQNRLTATPRDIEVKTWIELSAFYRQIVGFFNTLFGFITLAMFTLVFFMILQVLTLSFLERTREVGTIRAIGTKQGQIFRMFLVESLILGVLGAISGIGLGMLMGIGFNSLGLGWTPPGGTEDVPVKLALTLGNAGLPAVATILATIFSSLYPARKTSSVQIVDALRTS